MTVRHLVQRLWLLKRRMAGALRRDGAREQGAPEVEVVAVLDDPDAQLVDTVTLKLLPFFREGGEDPRGDW